MNDNARPLLNLLKQEIMDSINKQNSLDAEIERMINFLKEIKE